MFAVGIPSSASSPLIGSKFYNGAPAWMIGPNVQRQYNKGTYFQHYCIMCAFVVCYPLPFSSVVVFW